VDKALPGAAVPGGRVVKKRAPRPKLTIDNMRVGWRGRARPHVMPVPAPLPPSPNPHRCQPVRGGGPTGQPCDRACALPAGALGAERRVRQLPKTLCRRLWRQGSGGATRTTMRLGSLLCSVHAAGGRCPPRLAKAAPSAATRQPPRQPVRPPPPPPTPPAARPQVRDLRRLIELYQRWQQRVFPSIPFDEFIGKLEKMSGTMVLRVRSSQPAAGGQLVMGAGQPPGCNRLGLACTAQPWAPPPARAPRRPTCGSCVRTWFCCWTRQRSQRRLSQHPGGSRTGRMHATRPQTTSSRPPAWVSSCWAAGLRGRAPGRAGPASLLTLGPGGRLRRPPRAARRPQPLG
jgi:hypothetical protein